MALSGRGFPDSGENDAQMIAARGGIGHCGCQIGISASGTKTFNMTSMTRTDSSEKAAVNSSQ
jgi:hypothetical protein